MVVLIPRGDISFQKHITFKNNSQIMDKHVDHVNHNVTECIPTKDCREPYSEHRDTFPTPRPFTLVIFYDSLIT